MYYFTGPALFGLFKGFLWHCSTQLNRHMCDHFCVCI